MQHPLFQHDGIGGALAFIAALGSWFCAEVAKGDAFLHGLASIATMTAACLSIYFTLRPRKK